MALGIPLSALREPPSKMIASVLPMVLTRWNPIADLDSHRPKYRPFFLQGRWHSALAKLSTVGFDLEYRMDGGNYTLSESENHSPTMVKIPCQWCGTNMGDRFNVRINTSTMETPGLDLSYPDRGYRSMQRDWKYELGISQAFDLDQYGHRDIMNLFMSRPSRSRWLQAADMAEAVSLNSLAVALREIVAVTANLDWWENKQ